MASKCIPVTLLEPWAVCRNCYWDNHQEGSDDGSEGSMSTMCSNCRALNKTCVPYQGKAKARGGGRHRGARPRGKRSHERRRRVSSPAAPVETAPVVAQ